MISEIKTFFSKKKILFLIYLFFVFLATPSQFAWWIKGSFWIFCLFLFFIVGAYEKLKAFDQSPCRGFKSEKLKVENWWLLAPLGILIITRIIPFLRWGEAPLGYDTGIYLKLFEDCFARIASGGCRGVPLTFISNLLYLFGWQTNHLLSVFYIALNVFAGLGIYMVTKEYFNKQAAFFSFLIFSLSASQFLAYFAFYWGMMLALMLSLVSFWLLKKKSWLVVPVAGFMGAIHPLSFLSFGLAMLLYFVFVQELKTTLRDESNVSARKGRWLSKIWRSFFKRLKGFTFLSGIGIFLIAFSISWQTFLGYLPFYTKNLGLIKGYPGYMTQELTGQFINFDLYRGLILIYLPFAIFGLAQLLQKKKFNYLFFYFLVNFAIIVFHLVFYSRYILLLDLAAIVLAGEILFEFTNQLSITKLGKAAVVFLLVGTIFSAFYQGWQAKPFVGPEELREIKSLRETTEKNAYVMAVASYYSPWVYGFSERKTIAPGLFEHNKWDLLTWQTFWFTPNLELRHQLLNEYEKPLYIFTGDKTGKMDFSADKAFVRISPRVWRYQGEVKEAK